MSRLDIEQWKPFQRQSIRTSGSSGGKGCSVCWGMVRVCATDSQPWVTGKVSIILEGGPENRWPPSFLPQLEPRSPSFEGVGGEHHLKKDLEGL